MRAKEIDSPDAWGSWATGFSAYSYRYLKCVCLIISNGGGPVL